MLIHVPLDHIDDNPFLNSQSSRLRDAGWEFVIVNNSHETYTVQITALPRPPEPPAPEPEPDPPAPPPPAPAPNGLDTRPFQEFNAFPPSRPPNT